jgi:hypothetical protein
VAHHWRGIVQTAIVVTAITATVASAGTLSVAGAVFAGSAIGAVSSGANYVVGCAGTSETCTATGALTAVVVGGVSGAVAEGLGSEFCPDSTLCLSAVGVGVGSVTATGGYYAANALQGICPTGKGASEAAESGLSGATASQSAWNRIWNDFKRSVAGGSGGDE